MDENGLRLTNPVVICLNLVSAQMSANAPVVLDYTEELQVGMIFSIVVTTCFYFPRIFSTCILLNFQINNIPRYAISLEYGIQQ